MIDKRSLVIGFVLSSVAFFIMHLFFISTHGCGHKEYVYVDVEAVIGSIGRELADAKDPEEAIKVHKGHFQEILEKYRLKHNAIIFSSPKPIAGAIDITEHFMKELKEFNVKQAKVRE